MGVFDSLIVKCPNCGKQLEFQSKSGVCALYNFGKYDLPPDVAIGMTGDIVKCSFCNKNILLTCGIPEKVKVNLKITKKKPDYPGN